MCSAVGDDTFIKETVLKIVPVLFIFKTFKKCLFHMFWIVEQEQQQILVFEKIMEEVLHFEIG